MSPGQIFFGLSGRLNRGKFWLYSLFWVVVLLIGLLVIALGVSGASESIGASTRLWRKLLARAQQGEIAALLLIALSIPAMVSGVALSIKRLHDRNKSAWWLLLFYALPIVAADEILQQAAGSFGASALDIVAAVAGLWGFIEIGFLPGTRGPNRYGPDPLADLRAAATP